MASNVIRSRPHVLSRRNRSVTRTCLDDWGSSLPGSNVNLCHPASRRSPAIRTLHVIESASTYSLIFASLPAAVTFSSSHSLPPSLLVLKVVACSKWVHRRCGLGPTAKQFSLTSRKGTLAKATKTKTFQWILRALAATKGTFLPLRANVTTWSIPSSSRGYKES